MTLTKIFKNIADAIRERAGIDSSIPAKEFAKYVYQIPTSIDSSIEDRSTDSYNNLEEIFNDIATAIKIKKGTNEPIFVKDFSQEIINLPYEQKDYELYAFHVNQTTESDPSLMITYPENCDNTNYFSAKMDFINDIFDYGSWKDAFFIKNLKVVMLSQEGKELYEIDPSNYTKKKDGTDVGEEGNVMIAFPRVYFKIILDENEKDFTVYVSNKQLDDDYKCYAHISVDGDILDYCYIGAYEASKKSNISQFCCLSGKTPATSSSLAGYNELPLSTNIGWGWYDGLLVDYQMINMLLTLIGKSTNQQKIFGTGLTLASAKINTGTMDTKGLFWGDNTYKSGVKVFGIENYYGNLRKRIRGWMCQKGQQVVKLTYGTEDGATKAGYNTSAEGYIPIGEKLASGTKSGFITEMLATKYGLFPVISNINDSSNVSPDSDWCDYAYFDAAYAAAYACVGGYWMDGTLSGGFSVYLNRSYDYTYEGIGYSLSFKKKVS